MARAVHTAARAILTFAHIALRRETLTMRCYSWSKGQLTPGIAITDPNGHVPRIFLARDGVDYDKTFQLYKTNPPKIRTERGPFHFVDNAHVAYVSRKDATKTPALCMPDAVHATDRRVLVHINTYYDPIQDARSSNGFVRFERGEAETLYSYEHVCEYGVWSEYVVRMALNSLVVIGTETKRCHQYALVLDEHGELYTLPLPQYHAEQALIHTE